MTVEPINGDDAKKRTRPEKQEYAEIRESLMENENRVCIVAHGLMSGDAHCMTVALRGTKPNGDFHASTKTYDKNDTRPAGVDIGTSVWAGYKLDDKNLEKLMGEKWIEKLKAKRPS